jgi:DNA-binding response OmpR family regulator
MPKSAASTLLGSSRGIHTGLSQPIPLQPHYGVKVAEASAFRGGDRRELWKSAATLISRAPSLLRRSTAPSERTLRSGDVRIDVARRRVSRGNRLIRLTPREFDLLHVLVGNDERVLTRSEIYECVWGYDFGRTSNALGVYVGYLRRKLEAGGEPRVIHTVRGVGYVFGEGP